MRLAEGAARRGLLHIALGRRLLLAALYCRYYDGGDEDRGDKAFNRYDEREEPIRGAQAAAAVFQRSGRKRGRFGDLGGGAFLDHYGEGQAAVIVVPEGYGNGVSAGIPGGYLVKLLIGAACVLNGERVLPFLYAVIGNEVVYRGLHAHIFALVHFQSGVVLHLIACHVDGRGNRLFGNGEGA